MKHIFLYILLLSIACKGHYTDDDSNRYDGIHSIAISDSNRLQHIKDVFYRDATGRLFERTMYQVEHPKDTNGLFKEYFTSDIPQYIDPLTFEGIGWYARDKHHVYFLHPMDGGMVIIPVNSADRKSFKLLDGSSTYAMDNRHLYHESSIIGKINVSDLHIYHNKKGRVTRIVSGNNEYKIDSLD